MSTKKLNSKWFISLAIVFLVIISRFAWSASATGPNPEYGPVVVVKFVDDLQVRLRNGDLKSLRGYDLASLRGVLSKRARLAN